MQSLRKKISCYLFRHTGLNTCMYTETNTIKMTYQMVNGMFSLHIWVPDNEKLEDTKAPKFV